MAVISPALASPKSRAAPEAPVISPPETARSLLMVVVPVEAPRETVEAAPPIFKMETPELTKLKVEAVEVRSPPLTAKSPAVVTLPVETSTENSPLEPTVKLAPVTSTPAVALTLPAKVTCPVEAKFKAPVPEVERVLAPRAILVEASKVMASASSVKSRQSVQVKSLAVIVPVPE